MFFKVTFFSNKVEAIKYPLESNNFVYCAFTLTKTKLESYPWP